MSEQQLTYSLSHLQEKNCLPFPAGPLIPRLFAPQCARDPASHDAKQRAQLAFDVMKRYLELRPGDGVDKKTGFIRSLRSAFLEWQSRHDASAFEKWRRAHDLWDSWEAEQKKHGRLVSWCEEQHLEAEKLHNNGIPGQRLLQAIYALSDSNQNGYASERFNQSLKTEHKRIKFPHRKRVVDEKKKLERAGPSPKLAYDRSHYECACLRNPEAIPAEAGPPHAFVKAVLARAGGEWMLLALFFLKQLHGHLAWRPKETKHQNSTLFFYQLVLNVLRQLAGKKNPDLYSEVAAGLLCWLPRLHPYYAGRGDGETFSEDCPECFDPKTLGKRDLSLNQARELLLWQGDLAQLAFETDGLAHEVASRLTDPVRSWSIKVTEQALEHWRYSFKRHGDAIRKSAKEGTPLYAESDMTLQVQQRLARMLAYVNCMQIAGLALVSKQERTRPGAHA